MAFVEIDDVAIPLELIDKLKAGDKQAIEEAKKLVEGLTLYMHALSVDLEKEGFLTLRELEQLGVVKWVVIHTTREALEA